MNYIKHHSNLHFVAVSFFINDENTSFFIALGKRNRNSVICMILKFPFK